MDAILAGDFDTALAQYTKIRDAYIAMEDNEKAEETTRIMLSLQKQAREMEQMAEEAVDQGKAAALDALVAGDLETALGLYEDMLKTCVETGDEAGANEARAMIASLKEQMESPKDDDGDKKPEETKSGQPETEGAGEDVGASGPGGPGNTGSSSAPGGKNRWEGIEGNGQQLFDQCLDEALRATARQDYESAIRAYREIENLYNRYGNSETTVRTDVIIERLNKLMEEGN